jgi:hypothetical protein
MNSMRDRARAQFPMILLTPSGGACRAPLRRCPAWQGIGHSLRVTPGSSARQTPAEHR